MRPDLIEIKNVFWLDVVTAKVKYDDLSIELHDLWCENENVPTDVAFEEYYERHAHKIFPYAELESIQIFAFNGSKESFDGRGPIEIDCRGAAIVDGLKKLAILISTHKEICGQADQYVGGFDLNTWKIGMLFQMYRVYSCDLPWQFNLHDVKPWESHITDLRGIWENRSRIRVASVKQMYAGLGVTFDGGVPLKSIISMWLMMAGKTLAQ